MKPKFGNLVRFRHNRNRIFKKSFRFPIKGNRILASTEISAELFGFVCSLLLSPLAFPCYLSSSSGTYPIPSWTNRKVYFYILYYVNYFDVCSEWKIYDCKCYNQCYHNHVMFQKNMTKYYIQSISVFSNFLLHKTDYKVTQKYAHAHACETINMLWMSSP